MQPDGVNISHVKQQKANKQPAGLLTKDETSETTVKYVYCLFPYI